MLKDRYGNQVSTSSQTALRRFNDACELIRLYRGDPIASLDEALSEDPDFGMAWAVRAGVLIQQTDLAYSQEIARSLRAGAVANCSDREREHLAAVTAWAEGRIHEGVSRFARIAQNHPRDLIATQASHVGCFFTGQSAELRDGPLQALRAFQRQDDGYHALLGMAAFGYEENGDYGRAEAAGREAASLEPRDGWAVHAVAHVYEMKGDTDKGISWLRDSSASWAPESGFAYHNWWHLALLHLDRREFSEVLRLFDTKIRPAHTSVILEMIDASALLWRLRLEGIDCGERWGALADSWARAAEQGLYAFNDLHALMAFLGAGRTEDVARTIASMERAAAGAGDNAEMTRRVGLPLASAFVSFAEGHYAAAYESIRAVRGIAIRFGGSHAQRDILTLTMLHAALRGGLQERARAIAAERLTHKPHSPWARALHRQALDTAADVAA